VPGSWSITKEHPKDERECHDTHSHGEDQKNACHRIDHVGFTEFSESEYHEVLEPLNRTCMISKPSTSAIGTKRTFQG